MEKKAIMARKTIKFIDRSIDRVLMILLLIMLFIGFYFIYDSWYVYNHASLDRIPGYVWKGAETLADLPEDARAWLVIDDTKIDCPLMQGKTNDEYLNKNPYGEYSLSGSIFLDSENSPDFSDQYSLLYGHNMSGGYMFGALNDFLDEDFFDSHRTGTLTLKDGKVEGVKPESEATTVQEQIANDPSYKTEFKVRIFAVVETDASVNCVFNVHSGEDLLSYIRENAKIFREPEGYRILALSTCKIPLNTERIVVFAELIPVS